MAEPASGEITQLLRLWNDGDSAALEKLTPLVYRELHRLAVRYLANERPGHTLQATGLVNEAYVRLIDWRSVQWQNRAHFVAVSAQLMRRVLVDYAGPVCMPNVEETYTRYPLMRPQPWAL